ncbi:MAG: glycosyltransferase family 1 protein, partial [Xanthomonadales bacterium]|nr:glycosyltransferase family 1 protein [Xanthomonadales bacterium]
KMLADSRLATAIYSTVMPGVMGWRLRQFSDYLFHSPNFFLPPTSGPAVATFHDLSVFDHPEFHPLTRVDFMRRAIPRTLRRTSGLIADSAFTRQRIIEHFNWPEDRVHTVLLGVDVEQFAPLGADEACETLAKLGLQRNGYSLCLSTIEPRKNLDRLIAAYRELPASLRDACPLVIAGDRGWHSEQTHDLIRRCEQEGWLRYLGYLPQDLLPGLLAGCALFVFPSLYEGFGLPVLEAMASGAAVLSADIAPVREFAGDTIRYFDPLDTDSIRSGLLGALDDTGWRQSAGLAAHEQAAGFSWSESVQKLIDIYRQYSPAGDAG